MTAGTTLLETGAVIGLPRTVLAKHADDAVLRSLRIGRDVNPAAAHAVRELLVPTPEVCVGMQSILRLPANGLHHCARVLPPAGPAPRGRVGGLGPRPGCGGTRLGYRAAALLLCASEGSHSWRKCS